MIDSIKLLEKVVLVIIAIATIIAIGYEISEMYAELSVDGINRKPTMFKGYFEYTTETPPIQGEKCSKKAPICDYRMTVPQFIKEMEMKGWILVSASTGNGGGFIRNFHYIFRKE